MNLVKPLLYICIGCIISTALIQYTNIQTNHVLIVAAIIAGLCIISLFFIKTKTSSSNSRASHSIISGKVKWFNKTKGFGFITQSNGEDVFVHQTSIKSHPKFLREGQAVTMNVVMDEKGPQAENVKVA